MLNWFLRKINVFFFFYDSLFNLTFLLNLNEYYKKIEIVINFAA